jgi:hypothetical protein
MSAANAVMSAIYAALSGDAALSALLGGGVISDRLMERAKLPAIVLSAIDSRDYSTASEAGEEHFITLDIWADGQGRKAALTIAARVKALLHDVSLSLGSEHHLVAIRLMEQRSLRQKQRPEQSLSLRFRAVTETVSE